MKIIPRRPFNDDQPDGLVESDKDFVHNNLEACVQLLERELALKSDQRLVEIDIDLQMALKLMENSRQQTFVAAALRTVKSMYSVFDNGKE